VALVTPGSWLYATILGEKRIPVERAEGYTMGDLLQPWHLILIAIVAFLLFGAKRLPELGKGLGEGLKGFREGIKGVTDPAPPPTQQSTQNPPPPPPSSTEPPKQA
jgi:sec-independent protein translocase protein TatA